MSALTFEYRALDRSGRSARGTVSAASRDQALRQVTESGLTPLSIREARGGGPRVGGRVRTKDIAQFTYQLRVLLEARIPISDGLTGLAQQEDNQAFKRVLLDIASRVESGQTIASAMHPHRKVFGDVYVETISAAEQSGTMLRTLDHLSEAVERLEEGRRQVLGAMLYPACVLATLALGVSFLITYTIPKFASMFAARGVPLPLLTRALAGLGDSVRSFWWLYLCAAVGAVVLVRFLVTRRRAWVDRQLHRLPIIKQVLVPLAIGRFARVFSVSLSAGLGLLDALEMSKRACGREMLARDADSMADRVRGGQRLSEGLAASSYFPSFARRMLTAGEQSGELVRMAEIVARTYERETAHRIKALSTVLEPLLVMTIAIVVLTVALAIFLPMWNMVQLMG